MERGDREYVRLTWHTAAHRACNCQALYRRQERPQWLLRRSVPVSAKLSRQQRDVLHQAARRGIMAECQRLQYIVMYIIGEIAGALLRFCSSALLYTSAVILEALPVRVEDIVCGVLDVTSAFLHLAFDLLRFSFALHFLVVDHVACLLLDLPRPLVHFPFQLVSVTPGAQMIVPAIIPVIKLLVVGQYLVVH